METIQALVTAAQGGDLEAFGEIVRRFQAMAYAGAYAVVGDTQLAEDVAQEAFMEAYSNLSKLREPAAFPGWFRRIIFKQGDRVRRGKRVVTISLEAAFDVPLTELNPAIVVEKREMSEAVRHAVDILPEHERIVTILFYSTGYALKEIAAFLEVPVTTVKKRLYAARQHLKEELLEGVRESFHDYRKAQIMDKEYSISIPVGTSVLGRILNAGGEPLDQRGPISAEAVRLPLYTFSTTQQQDIPDRMIETGIKPIDLLAPLPRGGVIGMFSEQGLGKMVVMEEIMSNFIAHQHGVIVFVGVSESTYEATELRDMIRDIEVEDKVAMVYEQRGQHSEQQLLRAGLTIAAAFRDDGREVLLVIGKDVMTRDKRTLLQEVRQAARMKGITTFLFEPLNNRTQSTSSDQTDELDGYIIFSRAMAKQDLWPAIDRLQTTSHLLENRALSTEHVQVAQQVKELLQKFAQEQGSGAGKKLSDTEQVLWHRTQKVQFFLTQPFTVAEAYTNRPGEYLTIGETVKSFKELVEGRYDEVPDKAFYFVGTIEQALVQGKNL